MSRPAPARRKQPPITGGKVAATLAEVARQELLGFPARLLPLLPVGIKFAVQVGGFACLIRMVSWRSSAPDPRDGAAASPLFDGDELIALATAVQTERIWPADFKGYCLRKLHEPGFRVTEEIALSGAQPDAGPLWSLDRILRALDLTLSAIEFIESEDLAESVAPAQPSTALRQQRSAAAA